MVDMLIGAVTHFHRVAITLTCQASKLMKLSVDQYSHATSPTSPASPMSPPITRPEDRQRNGACDVGGFATGPECYRSEAFAEDLSTGPADTPPALFATKRAVTATSSRAGWSLLGVSLATLLGASGSR
jgi:hypothetical protein